MLPQHNNTTDRRIPVEGTVNFRDVGGYPLVTGGTTRWGQLFRSDHLAQLTDAGRARMRDFGIRRIIDLRSDVEVAGVPSALDGLDVQIVEHPIFSGSAQSAMPVDVTLTSLYITMIDEHTPALIATLKHIAEADDDAVLVHCMGGKDRTGLTVALALLAVGVDRATVVEDYALTADNLAGAWVDAMIAKVREYGIDPDDVMEILAGSPASAMEETLDYIDARYGSIAAYLDGNGFDTPWVERLSRKLTAVAREE